MRLAALSLLSLLSACAPASSSDPGAGGKADDVGDDAACSAGDLETLELCVSEGCPGLSGASLDTCLQETCGEDLQRVDDGCEACVLGGLDDGQELGEVTETCGAAPEPELCSADDFEWLFLCRDEGCPDADDLETCLIETCGEEIEAMSDSCRGCFVHHSDQDASDDDLEASCGAAPATDEPACAGDDAETVDLCLTEGCPDADDLETCLQETCGEDLDRVAEACSLCVFESVDGGAAGIGEACL